MRLSWWLGRLRRIGPPLVVLLVIGYFFYGHQTSPMHNGGSESADQITQEFVPAPSVEPLLSCWMVIHTHLNETCNVLSVKYPGWNFLIVGPYKPKEYSPETCVHIGEDELYIWRNSLQLEQTVDSLSIHVLAYLFLIKSGADTIYLLEPQTALNDLKELQVFPRRQYQGLVFRSNDRFHAADHFGCRTNHRDRIHHQAYYSLCQQRIPGIQVQTPLHLQSQDSVRNGGKVPVCDPRAPPVTLSTNRFVEFYFRNSLYMKDAFWALPILFRKHAEPSREQLVWNQLVQRILWLTGQRVLVHSASPSFSPEITSTQDLESIVSSWKCSNLDVFMCIMELVKTLVEKSWFDASVGPTVHEWLYVLDKIGYKVPVISNKINDTCSSDDIIFHPVNYSQTVYRRTSYSAKPYIPSANMPAISSTYEQTCSAYKGSSTEFKVKINFTHPWIQYEDVLLVITYNNPHYEAIQYIESLYRPFFPYMLHCGPGLPDFQNKTLNLEKFVFTFYSYGGTPDGRAKGSFNYQCITSAINMHYPVEGYLVIADDLLLSIYKTFDLRRYLPWFVPERERKMADIEKVKECRLGMCTFYPHWHWWEDYRAEVLALLDRFEKEQHTSTLVNRCYRQLLTLNGGKYRINGAYSDIYYIPARLAAEFAILASIFHEEKVFLEITIPTILRCIENPEDLEILRGIASWEVDRDSPWNNFNRDKFLGQTYLHPTKWGYLAKSSKEFTHFYCNKVVPYLHDQFGRLYTI